MKRFLLLCLLFPVTVLYAERIPLERASEIAAAFLQKDGKRLEGDSPRSKSRSSRDNLSRLPYYAFNAENESGFVIIAADDAFEPVVGYSDKGSFDRANIPPQLKKIIENPLSYKAKDVKSIRRSASSTPYYETPEWGQGYPYNSLCPRIDGESTQAGCVATALAIAMKYHNWPDYTRGGQQTDGYNEGLTFDYSNYNINWDILSDKNNPKFNDEVAKLMLSVGVACPMRYNVLESEAEVWPMSHKLIQFFSYDKDCEYIDRESFGEEAWNGILRGQLENVGPVIYRGGGEVGHCFVIDGYDEAGLFHVNWGWDGSMNGYYALDFSDVGGLSFGENQGMIINIRPDKARREWSRSWVPNAPVYFESQLGLNGWNFMKPDLTPGEEIEFMMPFITLNNHIGYYGIGVVDENDNILRILENVSYNNSYSIYCDYPGMHPVMTQKFPELKAGERFQLISQETGLDVNGMIKDPVSNDPDDWRIVLGGSLQPSSFLATGNKSETTEYLFHVDEGLPFLFEIANSREQEFSVTRLKGADCADNIIAPGKGVSLEIIPHDNEGTPLEPLSTQSQTGPAYEFNIMATSDRMDVYVKYDYDGETEKIGEGSSDAVVRENGLVYRIENGEALLTGYDQTLPENVTIPGYVKSGDKSYPVKAIGQDALLFAPVKHLNLQCPEINEIGNCAFAGIDGLESLSTVEMKSLKALWRDYPFLGTAPENVYLACIPSSTLLTMLMSVSMGYRPLSVNYISWPNIYVSELPDKEENYFSCLRTLAGMSENEITPLPEAYYVPGITDELFASVSDLPVSRMWEYALDKKNCRVCISNLLPGIKIESVTVNGTESVANEEGFYEGTGIQGEDMDVVVEYKVGDKTMTTHYSPAYNSRLRSIDMSGNPANSLADAEQVDVYSMQGIRIRTGVTQKELINLPRGIYIIGGKKMIIE